MAVFTLLHGNFLIFCIFIASGKAFTVGIIGAGASGLYAAILLQSLDIEYEILEAQDRLGGRIMTHYFDEEKWKTSSPGQLGYYNYFDVGAMRIPRTRFMDRLIGDDSRSLVRYLNNRVTEEARLSLVPFYEDSSNTFLYFNQILLSAKESLDGDPFRLGQPSGPLPPTFAKQNPRSVWDDMIHSYTSLLSSDIVKGLSQLSTFPLSVRQYLTTRGLSAPEIDWLETFGDATGHYDCDLMEVVFEDWIFNDENDHEWVTIEGGMSRLTSAMESTLQNQVRRRERVVAISQLADSGFLTVATTNSTYHYDHVISTVPLGAMQAMDLSTLNLGYSIESAIRMINYDSAVKIGIKFKTRWWQTLPNPIFGGQSYSDLPIRTCVYPSYGLNVTDAAAVMIASYTWGQDAARLSSYLSTPQAREHLVALALRNLATLNNVTYEFLQSQYVDYFAYSWYNDEFSVGAFPEFGPGQFAGLMPQLMTPSVGGRLHFGGDAVSAGHAWIVGALNSAYRCVREILRVEGKLDMVRQLEVMWGPLVDIEPVPPESGSNPKNGSTYVH